LDGLQVTDEDLAGTGRLKAVRLLRRPAWLPILGGLEPYKGLVDHLRSRACDARAVVEFPYDWRLPVEVNGRLLASRCQEVLDTWRVIVQERMYADPAEVRVVLVAHSMGGLVARFATEVFGAHEIVRSIITLGTPHFGAVKAVQMLATGMGMGANLPVVGNVELPRRLRAALQSFALGCPGVYDLLPRYRCVTTREKPADRRDPTGLRYLTDDDVTTLGADRALAAEARARHAKLANVSASRTPILPLVGAEQPTLQSLTLTGGTCEFHQSINGEDDGGDATVYRKAAAPLGVSAFPLPQRHGALAKSSEAFTFVVDKLRGADTGLPLGTRSVAADIPDTATAGEAVTVTVSERDRETGAPLDPLGVTVSSVDVDTGIEQLWPEGRRFDDTLVFTGPVHRPGLYRVLVSAGGSSPVSDLMMVDDSLQPLG
jgi:hypothetical protein